MISVEKPGSPEEMLARFEAKRMPLGSTKPGSPSEILEHHGIKGMQWGVRKEREASVQVSKKITQVKSKRDARRERRAKGHEAEADKAQKRIDEIKANRSRWGFVQRNRNRQVKDWEQYRDKHIEAAKDIRAGKLTHYQKKVIIGASIVVGVLAAYGTYKMVDSGAARQMLTKDHPLKKNDLLSRHMSPDSIMKEVVEPINPGYGGIGTKNNCRRATFAYEMRRRGFDVAATRSHAGTGQTPVSLLNAIDPESNLPTGKTGIRIGLFKELYRNVKAGRDPGMDGPLQVALKTSGLGEETIFKRLSTSQGGTDSGVKSKMIYDALSRNPEGARGELGVGWHFGGAHSLAWEIIGGKPQIFDTQTGVHYTQELFTSEVARSANEASLTRLDNIDLNTGYLRRWVRNVK